jgi:hypothetical protein
LTVAEIPGFLFAPKPDRSYESATPGLGDGRPGPEDGRKEPEMRSRTMVMALLTAAIAWTPGCGGDGGGSGLTCAAGTHELDGECVPDVVCAAGTHEEAGECVADVVCATGTHEEAGECVPDVVCGAGTHDEGGEIGRAHV